MKAESVHPSSAIPHPSVEECAAVAIHVVLSRHSGEAQKLVMHQHPRTAQLLLFLAVGVLRAPHGVDERHILLGE